MIGNETDTLLEIENLSVSYENNKKPVIYGADLSVQKGCLTALLGLNGSGKTTLLKAACGLIPSRSDRFNICGQDAGKMTCGKRASSIAYISQKHSIVYHINAEDVALMGINPYLKWFQTPSQAHRKLAEQMLGYMGLHEAVGEDFISLSEGQKQLVILARALVQDAPIMMFDEPDSALDYENKRKILEKIRQVIQEKNYGGLITLHDPDYALHYCDKILLLQNGRIQDTIYCKETSREEIREKLRIIYPGLELLAYKDRFLTVK